MTVPGIGEEAISVLAEAEGLIGKLFSRLADGGELNQTLDKIIVLQDRLYAWLNDANGLIQKKLETKRLEAECQVFEKKITHLTETLVTAERDLSELVFAMKSRHKLMLAARSNPVDNINEFLAYARNVSFTSSAPYAWDPSQPLRLFRPPNPQEDMMRNSLLYQKMIPSKQQMGEREGGGGQQMDQDQQQEASRSEIPNNAVLPRKRKANINNGNSYNNASSSNDEFDIFDLDS